MAGRRPMSSTQPLRMGKGEVVYGNLEQRPLLNSTAQTLPPLRPATASSHGSSRPGSARRARPPSSGSPNQSAKKPKKGRKLRRRKKGGAPDPELEQKYIGGLKERIEHLQIELQHQKEKRKRAKEGVGAATPLEDMLETLRGKYTAQQKEIHQTAEELEEKLAEATEENGRLLQRNQFEREKVETLTARIERLEQELERERDEKMVQKVALDQAVDNSSRKLAAAARQQEEFVESVRAERERMQEQHAALEDKIKKLDHVRAIQEKKLVEQSRLARDLEVKVIELSDRTAGETEPLKEQIEALRDEKTDLEHQLRQSDVALQRAQAAAAKQDDIMEQLMAESNDLKLTVQHLKDANAEHEKRWKENEARGGIWSTAVVDLRRENKDLATRAQSLQAQLTECQKERDAARARLAHAEALHREAEERCARQAQDLKLVQDNEARLEHDNTELRKDVALAQDELHDLQALYKRDTTDIERLRLDNEDLRLSKQMLETKLAKSKEVDVVELQNFQKMLQSHAQAAASMQSLMSKIRVDPVTAAAPHQQPQGPVRVSPLPLNKAALGDDGADDSDDGEFTIASATVKARHKREETPRESQHNDDERDDSGSDIEISDMPTLGAADHKTMQESGSDGDDDDEFTIANTTIKTEHKRKGTPKAAAVESDDEKKGADDDDDGFTIASTPRHTAERKDKAGAAAAPGSDSDDDFTIASATIKSQHKRKETPRAATVESDDDKKKKKSLDSDDEFAIADSESDDDGEFTIASATVTSQHKRRETPRATAHDESSDDDADESDSSELEISDMPTVGKKKDDEEEEEEEEEFTIANTAIKTQHKRKGTPKAADDSDMDEKKGADDDDEDSGSELEISDMPTIGAAAAAGKKQSKDDVSDDDDFTLSDKTLKTRYKRKSTPKAADDSDKNEKKDDDSDSEDLEISDIPTLNAKQKQKKKNGEGKEEDEDEQEAADDFSISDSNALKPSKSMALKWQTPLAEHKEETSDSEHSDDEFEI